MKRSNVSKLALFVPLVLLVALGLSTATTQKALAWGDWGGAFLQQGPGAYSNGFYAGQQDAIYDHDNNLVYNPVGTCIPCHSELYWHAFHQSYDAQWNQYQSQAQNTDQRTNVNIYGNNNYVSVGQSSNQGQDQNQQQGPSESGPFPPIGPFG